jgi:hypothetical protein
MENRGVSKMTLSETQRNAQTEEEVTAIAMANLADGGPFGDLTAAKTGVINERPINSLSWLLQVARFPTATHKIVLELFKSGMSPKDVAKTSGFSPSHVAACLSIARRLGVIPQSDHWLAKQHRAGAMRDARNKARSKVMSWSEREESKKHIDYIYKVMGITGETGKRPNTAAMMKFSASKAFKALEKRYQERIAAEAAAAPAPLPMPVAEPIRLVTEQAKSGAFSEDPAKRVIEVTLQMTIEELQAFTASVNASKRT